MTQILMYHSLSGIVLAADGRAVVHSEADEAPEFITVQKLFQLTPQAVLAAGGAGYGILLCQGFLSYIQRTGIQDIEEVIDHALPFFSSRIDVVRQRSSPFPVQAELERVYILIAGCTFQPADTDPFQVAFIASDSLSDPLHTVKTGNVLTIPRQLGVEYSLSRLDTSYDSIQTAEAVCEKYLHKMAKDGNEVGFPFYVARITLDGIRIRIIE